MKNSVKIQAMYDFLCDQIESGYYHLDDVQMGVSKYLENFLSIGCEPAKLATMMDPTEVLDRIELFDGIDINPVAERLDPINFEVLFDKLVSLGLKAETARKAVAQWNGETIVKRIAKLLKCGFTKKELSDLLHDKLGEYDSNFDDENYLDLVSTSEHLYDFLSKECLEYSTADGGFFDGYYGREVPFNVEALRAHGADEEIISEWIADQMAWQIFNKDFREEMSRHEVFLSEDQIINALKRRGEKMSICELGDMNDLLKFIDKSENPAKLIVELDELTDGALTEYFEDDYTDPITEDRLARFPIFWETMARSFFENYNSGWHYEICNVLKVLEWFEISEVEWRETLSGHKEWIEECIEELSSDPDYKEEVEYLNGIIEYAS